MNKQYRRYTEIIFVNKVVVTNAKNSFFPFLGAVEKQKLVYILNRDSEARLTISSPLEAHKGNTLVFHMVGVDVGFENPTFACLEMDYEEADNDPTGEALQSAQQVNSP